MSRVELYEAIRKDNREQGLSIRALATSGRRIYLHLPSRWPWADWFCTMLDAIRSVELVT